jgi:hypothetical protein
VKLRRRTKDWESSHMRYRNFKACVG